MADAFTASQGGQFKVLAAADALRAAHVQQPDTLVRGDCLRLWPHRHETDGFFAAVWQRS